MDIATGETTSYVTISGSGPPLLLLHGFPETHRMWRDVAPRLAEHFTVVCADLRGYGQSGCPPSTPNHAPYAKRAMARDLVAVMAHLGFPRFSVAGHDRGGRVAYRLALDHPERIERLAVLDIVATADAWDRADSRLAISFWPWALLAQPEPLPERLILGAPDAIIDDAVHAWGTSPRAFDDETRQAYIDALRNPASVHAICEEYRAATTLDREHDEADRRNNRRIQCPLFTLWSADSALDHWYANEGGPLGLWKRWADDVTGHAIKGGHFFPEESPEETAAELVGFFREG